MFVSTREMLHYERNVNEAAIRSSIGSFEISELLERPGIRTILSELGPEAFSDRALRKIVAALQRADKK